jgi:hypothetical protein
MTRTAVRQVLCWQGWRLELPSQWNPTMIQGDYEAGSILIADLHRPRLGVRWKRAAKRLDTLKWARRALAAEVGQLAADEARPIDLPGSWEASMLYVDPDPPGRDVWVGYSPVSERCVELVHHAQRRDTVLGGAILPDFKDVPVDQPMPWSVFDLRCVVPPGMTLAQHQLNAGDLGLCFQGKHRLVTVRQIALAGLALKRQPLEKWLDNQQQRRAKHYRVVGDIRDIECGPADRALKGIGRAMHRRRRFFFYRAMPRQLVTAAFHDTSRDRLIIVQGSDEALVRECAASCCSPATPGDQEDARRRRADW